MEAAPSVALNVVLGAATLRKVMKEFEITDVVAVAAKSPEKVCGPAKMMALGATPLMRRLGIEVEKSADVENDTEENDDNPNVASVELKSVRTDAKEM